MKATRDDVRRRAARAREWREFRRRFLFTQVDLANAIGCCRRIVVAVEGQTVTFPDPDFLARFRKLKIQHAKGDLQWILVRA